MLGAWAELQTTGDIYRRVTATNSGRAHARGPPNSSVPHGTNRTTPQPTHWHRDAYPETKTSQPQSCSDLGIGRVPIPVQMQIQRHVTSSPCGCTVPDVSTDRSSFTPHLSPCLKFLVVFLNPTADTTPRYVVSLRPYNSRRFDRSQFLHPASFTLSEISRGFPQSHRDNVHNLTSVNKIC